MSSLHAAFYKTFQYRAAAPLGPQVQCLDVYSKVERSWLQRVVTNLSGSLRPLTPLGSMLNEKLMGADARWRSADATQLVTELRTGLDDLKDATVEEFELDGPFGKEKLLRKFDVNFSNSKGGVLWLSGVAGIDLAKDAMLSAELDGLTVASVNYLTICQWIMDGDWRPKAPTLEIICSGWTKDKKKKIKSLWIVSEVLYAKKLTVTVENGHLNKVMADASAIAGVPTLINARAEVGLRRVNESTLELKAYPDKQFVVGYRTIRVDYYPDESIYLIRGPDDGGLRADDDDPYRTSLNLMAEDIFEKDEDGDEVPIPLLALTEQELDDLIKAPSTNCQNSAASA